LHKPLFFQWFGINIVIMSYRFALIGCGRIAQRHASLIPHFGALTAVCDPDPQKCNDFSRQFGCSGYEAAAVLFQQSQADISVICSPNGLHASHAILALNAGTHVLCEKPMAITEVQCEEMIAAAESAGKRLFVVKQNRYNPPVQYVKNLMDQGRLGEISSFQLNCFWNRPKSYYDDPWRGTLDMDGGILFTQFSHFIDIIAWFFGDLIHASGVRGNYQHRGVIEFEDTGVAYLLMSSGAMGTLNYTINAYPKNIEGSLTIFGEKGTVKIGGPYLNTIEYFNVENESHPALTPSNAPNSYGNYEGSMSNHHLVYQEMMTAIGSEWSSAVEAREAMKSVEMIRKIYDSSPFRNGNIAS
jgi:UDP-N-acetyl-2-amino-2-deoxyglucuronate dehydrogenase